MRGADSNLRLPGYEPLDEPGSFAASVKSTSRILQLGYLLKMDQPNARRGLAFLLAVAETSLDEESL